MHRLVANENSLYVKRFTFICAKTGPYNYSKMWRLSKSPSNNHFCRLVTLSQTYANSADTDHANPVQSVCSESALFAINLTSCLAWCWVGFIYLFTCFSQRHIRLTLALYIWLFYGSVSGRGDFHSIPHRENLDSLCTHSDWSASPICDLCLVQKW